MNTPRIVEGASLRDGRVRLLVSVRSAAEARAAIEGGADVIDIKEPSRGPLGMADGDVMRAILETVGVRRPVSAALGELADTTIAPLPPGLSFVKIGLAAALPDWPAQLAARQAVHRSARFIAAAYADAAGAAAPSVEDVLGWAVANHAAGLLIDTFAKDGRQLFDHLPESQLGRIVTQAHAAGLIVALAGSITAEALPVAVALQPDLIAVRGAACSGGGRTGVVDAACVRRLADLIAAPNVRTCRAEPTAG